MSDPEKAIAIVGHELPVLAVLRARENENPKIFRWHMGVPFLKAIAGGFDLGPETVLRGPISEGKHIELARHPQKLKSEKPEAIRITNSWRTEPTWIDGGANAEKSPQDKQHDLVIHHAATDADSKEDDKPYEQTRGLIYISDAEAFGDDIWRFASQKDKQVVIVASIHGLADWMRVRLSGTYEAMAVDILNGLKSRLRGPVYNVAQCHLVVRLGNAAALLIHWNSGSLAKAKIYYRKDRLLPLEHPGLGRMLGYRSILAAALAEALVKLSENGDAEAALSLGIARGLDYCEQFFTDGWRLARTDTGKEDHWHSRPEEMLGQLLESARGWRKLPEKPERTGDWETVQALDVAVARATHSRKPWSILQQFVLERLTEALQKTDPPLAREQIEKLREKFTLPNPDEQPAGGWDATYYGAWAWRMLCSHQHFDDLVKDLPIAKLGKLRLLDRDEMQDYLGLHRLLVQYAGNREDAKPLNFGVFGAPGAGKSFGVKQVIEDLADAKLDYEKEPIVCNLSQLENRQGLIEVLHRVRNAGLKGKIPVVFFDEFDTRLEGRPFGWLGHFLAPMQDGEFEANGKTYHLGRCACFFAGGVSRTFAEMAARQRDVEFCQAKGPDFISRLRASLNIRGINRPEDEADPGRYLIRRALTLRDILHRRREKELGARERGVDPRLAWAFLRITGFKHGVRSLEAIINSCRFEPGKRLRASDLPPTEQLSIHVDAAEFLALLDEKNPLVVDSSMGNLHGWLTGQG